MSKQFIIGIDIGGSKIIVALVKDGKVFHKIKIETPKNKNEFLKKLEAIIEQLIEKAGGQKNIRGIGCGIGGVLDLKKGIILSWSNIKFLDRFNIKNWLTEKFKCEVKIDNDARCFTRGEYLFGAGKGYRNIVGMTLGTGVGGGIIINGKMVYGNGSAGELGHMIIDCGGDLESLTVKYMRGLKISLITSAYKNNKDRAIREALDFFEENLAIGIANVANILDPEAVIIGGGAAEAVKKIIPKIKKIADKFMISPESRKDVKILIGKLGEDAGPIGAAALFLEQKTRKAGAKRVIF